LILELFTWYVLVRVFDVVKVVPKRKYQMLVCAKLRYDCPVSRDLEHHPVVVGDWGVVWRTIFSESCRVLEKSFRAFGHNNPEQKPPQLFCCTRKTSPKEFLIHKCSFFPRFLRHEKDDSGD
jgi:hypothetical protein